MSMSRRRLTLFTVLLVFMKCGDSVKTNVERRFADSSDSGAVGSFSVEYPYWEDILREFLFKTISPPPPSNNILYKEILQAPLYAGPFPAPETADDYNGHETVRVLSRGDVYHLAEGGWIMCQDGCIDCEICYVQKSLNVPKAKWILRRIERLRPLAYSKRHDLQLTVLPQDDGSFHMKNLSPDSYVYVTSNNGVLASFTDTLIRKNDQSLLRYPFGTIKPPSSMNPGDIFISDGEEDVGLDQEEPQTDHQQWTDDPGTDNEVLQTTTTSIPKVARKRSREVLRDERNPELDNRKLVSEQKGPEENSTPLTTSHPSTTPMVKSIDYDFGREDDARLILGRDQFGEKHLVHVVPARGMDQEIERGIYPDSELLYQQPAHRRPVYSEHQDHPLYRKIFRRVIDSLNTHRNAIEKFLFSSKQEARSQHGQFVISSPRTFHKEEDPGLKSKNTTMRTSSREEDTESEDITVTTDNIEEIMEYSEESFPTFATTNVLTKEGEVSREGDQSQESNHYLDKYFDEENSDESFSDELIKRQNNSETLILKEVAKSVVNHPQGFNSLTDTTTPHLETDDSLPSAPDNTATRDASNSE